MSELPATTQVTRAGSAMRAMAASKKKIGRRALMVVAPSIPRPPRASRFSGPRREGARLGLDVLPRGRVEPEEGVGDLAVDVAAGVEVEGRVGARVVDVRAAAKGREPVAERGDARP